MAILDQARDEEQRTDLAARHRRTAVILLCAVVAAALCIVYTRGTGKFRSADELMLQHEDIAGKEAEQAEAKKLDSIEDPAVGSIKTGEQIESISKPLREGGLGVWLGRAQRPEENVWNINYLDKKTNEYYGVCKQDVCLS